MNKYVIRSTWTRGRKANAKMKYEIVEMKTTVKI